MTKLEYSVILENDKEKLFKIATDYENLTKYLPDQLKSVRISEKNQDATITESTVVLKTIFKKEISIVSKHTEKDDNTITTEIISGPAKGTRIDIFYEKKDENTEINVITDLKLSLKYVIMLPLIKKMYSRVLTSILYRMDNEIGNIDWVLLMKNLIQ